MDIKAKIEEIVKKVTSDKDLMAKFQKNPASVIKEITGLDLPADQVNQVVAAVKTKTTADGVKGALGGLFGKK